MAFLGGTGPFLPWGPFPQETPAPLAPCACPSASLQRGRRMRAGDDGRRAAADWAHLGGEGGGGAWRKGLETRRQHHGILEPILIEVSVPIYVPCVAWCISDMDKCRRPVISRPIHHSFGVSYVFVLCMHTVRSPCHLFPVISLHIESSFQTVLSPPCTHTPFLNI